MKTTQSRRNFLRMSATGALGAFALTQYSFKAAAESALAAVDPKTFGIGLQLYTIRDAMAKDVPGSLKKISDIGIKNLELASYSNGLGMDIISSHTQVEALGITLDNAKKMAEDHAKIGVKYCVQPWVVEEARTTLDSYKKMAAELIPEIRKLMKW